MEIGNKKEPPEGRVVFLRLSLQLYDKLEELRVQTKGRGIATVIKQIVEAAFAEGITVRKDEKRDQANNKAA